MTQNSLAKILKTFSIHSKSVRIGDIHKKGFELKQFSDAFARYIPIQSGTTGQTKQGNGYSNIQSGTNSQSVPLSNPLKAKPGNDCPVVPLQNPLSSQEENPEVEF